MKNIIFFLIVLFYTVSILGQQPVSPLLTSVSVNPFSGEVTLRWEKSPSSNTDGYIICEYLRTHNVWGGQNPKCLPNPNSTDTTFAYDTVSRRPTYFYILAYTGPCDPSNSTLTGYKNLHRTIFTSLNYDVCQSRITINWSKYWGWGDNLTYKIFQYKNSVVTKISGDLSPNDTSFTVTGIQGTQDYCYFVAAVHTKGDSVTSNMACQRTYEKGLPSYINADQAVFISNNRVQLQFTLDPASETKDYQLSVSDSHDGDFTPAKKFLNVQDNSLTIVDTLQRVAPKYYRLEALNSCDKGAKFSNKATAMVPIAAIGTNEITLTWNAYLDWPNGVSNYEIYRAIGDGGFQLLQNQSGSITDYTDNVSNLVGQQLSGNLCYYVEALPSFSSTGNAFRSRSATVCVDITANVFLPNAFTPNDDGQNDEFKPSFAFLPSAYSFAVFERSGFKIFETTDPMKGWNGRSANNHKAPEGVYVYFIRFTSESGKTVEKKGNFSLVYP